MHMIFHRHYRIEIHTFSDENNTNFVA